MTAYAELEIGLHKRGDATYEIDLRFSKPDSDAEIAPARGSVEINFDSLRAHELDPKVYGEILSAAVFNDDAVNQLYDEAKVAVDSTKLHLRVRLLIRPSAAELNSLRWELMTDPKTKLPLATSEKVLFSRFMLSQDWRPIKLRPKAELRALVAVAAPTNLVSKWKLPEIDVDGEIQRATEALGELGSGKLEVLGDKKPVTLDNLADRLRDGVDVLYLACHGAKHPKFGPLLYLADEGDKCKTPTTGEQLYERLTGLQYLPRLIVLASCESAGTAAESTSQTKGDVASLAPRLADAGVPAILAMQGKITMETVKQSMPVFFSELLEDGQIDRAMAVARGKVRERPDFWMPALYLRIKGGRIWYEPGFGEGEGDFEKWKSIVHQVRRGKAVAIIGSGVAESIYGDSRDLARKLAAEHNFPLAPHQRDDLPQVSQYLSVSQSSSYAVEKVRAQMRPVQRNDNGAASNPFQILAELPISCYVCATPDSLMFKALEQANKQPTLLYSNWRPSGEQTPVEPSYNGTPSAQTPIVYHMLGKFGKGQDESLVLTEDDYFDYLISTSTYKLVPRVVRSALVSSSLLFLGFQLMDWSFRVLFRLIHNLEGGSKRATFSHVGVQVNPEEHTLTDVQRARRYLAKYFDKEANVEIFWGSSEDFLRELHNKLDDVADEALTPVTEDDDDW